MKKVKFIVTITMVVCFLMTGVNFAEEGYLESDYLNSVMEMIGDNYSGDISKEELLEGALKGMFYTMDDYTIYYTKEEAEDFFSDIEGSYKGIGISFTKVDDKIIIEKVFRSSPAERAGIKKGDIIKEIDYVDVSGKSDDEVASMIRGEEGTTVILGIVREQVSRLIEIEVVREEIMIEPGEYKIDNNIGYIKLERFSSNAEKFIEQALDEMDKNNIKKIILDIRDNPGGEVGQAVGIAEKFVSLGLITRLEYKSEEERDEVYTSKLLKQKYDLVVLVNEMSASASEILAGAVQDRNAGILIGTKTYGKAKVQKVFPIITPKAYMKYKDKFGTNFINAYDILRKHRIYPSDDEIIGWSKMTVGRYYTPKGRMIDGEGLEPDIFVNNEIKGIDVTTVSLLSKTDKPGLGSESIDVYNAKKILVLSGYEIGNMDAVMDEVTFNSIARFQEDSGLYPYGVLDFSTQDALNAKFQKLIPEPDLQYYKAVEVLSSRS